MDRFETMTKDEAFLAGIWPRQHNDYGCVVAEKFHDGSRRFVGSDGGEPEDQTLQRDFGWVVPALNDAFQAGRDSAFGEIAATEKAKVEPGEA